LQKGGFLLPKRKLLARLKSINVIKMHFLKQTLIPHHGNHYQPHLIRRHGLFLALMLLVGVQVMQIAMSGQQGRVLGYASNITLSGLLSGTNGERASAGQSALQLSSTLNASAQAKANHMIANNYWSHNAPDGTTPWYFFDQAGYVYIVAGENLAYGFDTSAGVIAGWMGSPSHRENMLNSAYEEVGFGIADGSNFQGGPNTVVVAHYGDPQISNQAQTEPDPEPTPTSVSETMASPPPAPTTVPAPEPESVVEPVDETELAAPEQAPSNPAEDVSQEDDIIRTTITSEETRSISNLEALLSGQAGWALYVTASVAGLIGLVYLYRHVLFIHNAVMKSERFIVAHPMLEASIIYALIWLLLTGTFGTIL
jgi:hypothetical protein